MRALLLSSAILATVALSACAPMPAYESIGAAQAPLENLAAFQRATDKSAEIEIVRKGDSRDYPCYVGVYINSQYAGKLAAGEGARFFPLAGNVSVRITRDPSGSGVCANDGRSLREFNVTATADRRQSYSVVVDGAKAGA